MFSLAIILFAGVATTVPPPPSAIPNELQTSPACVQRSASTPDHLMHVWKPVLVIDNSSGAIPQMAPMELSQEGPEEEAPLP